MLCSDMQIPAKGSGGQLKHGDVQSSIEYRGHTHRALHCLGWLCHRTVVGWLVVYLFIWSK